MDLFNVGVERVLPIQRQPEPTWFSYSAPPGLSTPTFLGRGTSSPPSGRFASHLPPLNKINVRMGLGSGWVIAPPQGRPPQLAPEQSERVQVLTRYGGGVFKWREE